MASAGRQQKRGGSGNASRSVAAARGIEGAAREATWWRVGECAAAGQQSEREHVVAVTGVGASRSADQRPRHRGRSGAFVIECGRLQRRLRRHVPSIFVFSRGGT